MKITLLLLVFSVVAGFSTGCASYPEIAEAHRQRLLKIYPLHLTTRSEVASRWAPTKPELSYERPPTGWLALGTDYVGKKADAVEKTIAGHVARVERYFGVDGLFSLCRCWFYYDADEKLVDVEWQYVSD